MNTCAQANHDDIDWRSLVLSCHRFPFSALQHTFLSWQCRHSPRQSLRRQSGVLASRSAPIESVGAVCRLRYTCRTPPPIMAYFRRRRAVARQTTRQWLPPGSGSGSGSPPPLGSHHLLQRKAVAVRQPNWNFRCVGRWSSR